MTSSPRSRLAGAALLLLCAMLLWLQPLMGLRLPHQNDLWIHLQWSEQFLAALRDGWPLPRWAWASHEGLGDPTFVYYQPLFYYLTSAFSLLGLGPSRALLCGAMLPYALLGGVVYFMILERYPSRWALPGACFVMCCPVLVFLSAQMAAFPWTLSLPFSLLFILESTRERPRMARLGILLCLLSLAHLLSAMIALFSTGLGRLVLAFPRPGSFRTHLRSHLAWGLGVALGLGLASFFIFPAITQLALINPVGWTGGPNFDWRRAFAFPTLTFAQYGLRWPAIQWPFSVLALGMCVLSLRNKEQLRTQARGLLRDDGGPELARRLAIVGLAALVLGSELAYPLYAILPPLQKVQFPYRFMFVAAVLGSVALMIRLCEGAWRRWGLLARGAAVGLAGVYCLFGLYLQWDQFRHGEAMPDRAAYMAGHFGQAEYLPAVRGPHWKQYLADGKLDGECRRLGLRCEAPAQDTHALSVVVESPRAAAMRLPLFAFPAWSLSVDGQPQALAADPDTGLAVARLAPGRHLVALRWTGLAAEAAGQRISLASLALLLVLLGAGYLRRLRGARPVVDPLARQGVELRGEPSDDLSEDLAPMN
jgi:hypothetical protein